MATSSAAALAHLELHTPSEEAAVGFYTGLLGWRAERIDAAGRSYLALDIGDEGPGAGIVECGTKRALWLPYVEVPEVRLFTRRAQELGASTLLAPREGPAGWRSVVAAPDGSEIAFWQPKR